MKGPGISTLILLLVLTAIGGCSYLNNLPPIAACTATPIIGYAPHTLQFDASSSHDPDGDSLDEYLWDFDDGTTLSTSTPSAEHTYSQPGTYVATVQVGDGKCLSEYFTISVFVLPATTTPTTPTLPGNTAPQAVLQVTPSSGAAPLTVSLDASASTDADGSIAVYGWAFGDGGTETTVTPYTTHTYTVPGTYSAAVTVIDDGGATGTAARTIQITGTNISPDAQFSVNQSFGFTPLLVTFDASSSSDPDGTIASYAWDFGDGSADTGQIVTHIYQTAGNYISTLTVMDDDGATATASLSIVVSPLPQF